MPNSSMSYNEVGNDATLTASTEQTSYEVENVYNWTPGFVYRSAVSVGSADTLRVVWDFGVGNTQLVKSIFWNLSNIGSGDVTFEFQAGTTDATSDETQVLAKTAKGFQLLDSGTGWDYRYFAIEIEKADLAYNQLGSFFLYQDYYLFTKNYRADRGDGKETSFPEISGEFGNDHVGDSRYEKQIYSLTFDDLESTQKNIFDETIRPQKYVTFYDGARSEAFWGRSRFPLPQFVSDNYTGMLMTFREAN